MTYPPENRTDRRRKQRFPLHRELRYRLLQPEAQDRAGIGTVINASSAGIAFDCDRALPVLAQIEISMSWPVPLEDACPLRLVARGRVVRCEGNSVACTIDRFEFRTQARRHDPAGGAFAAEGAGSKTAACAA